MLSDQEKSVLLRKYMAEFEVQKKRNEEMAAERNKMCIWDSTELNRLKELKSYSIFFIGLFFFLLGLSIGSDSLNVYKDLFWFFGLTLSFSGWCAFVFWNAADSLELNFLHYKKAWFDNDVDLKKMYSKRMSRYEESALWLVFPFINFPD